MIVVRAGGVLLHAWFSTTSSTSYYYYSRVILLTFCIHVRAAAKIQAKMNLCDALRNYCFCKTGQNFRRVLRVSQIIVDYV